MFNDNSQSVQSTEQVSDFGDFDWKNNFDWEIPSEEHQKNIK